MAHVVAGRGGVGAAISSRRRRCGNPRRLICGQCGTARHARAERSGGEAGDSTWRKWLADAKLGPASGRERRTSAVVSSGGCCPIGPVGPGSLRAACPAEPAPRRWSTRAAAHAGSAAAGPGVRTRPPCATSLLTATNSAAAAVLCCSYVMAPISGSCVLLPQPVSALCGPQQRMEAHMAMLSLAPSADHTRTTNSSRRRALVAYTEAGAPMVRFSVAFRRFSHRFSTDSNPFGR